MAGARVAIFLDDLDSEKSFENTVNILEDIRRYFKKDHQPQILYDITENLNNREPIATQNTPLVGGRSYLWLDAREKWQDKELVQNALFCSAASYEENPLTCLLDNKTYHGVTELVAANVYFGKQAASIFISCAKGTEERKKTLIVAFRGTKCLEDVETDFQIGLETDDRFVGKIHGGFLKRMQSVDINQLFELSTINNVNQILTCGSSLGGAVSSLVHLSLLNCLHKAENPLVLPKNVINMTFGAPMFGNFKLAKHVHDKDYARNMFHFAYIKDIVPIVLSVGHALEVLKQKIPQSSFIISQLQTSMPLINSCLKVAANVMQNEATQNIQNALESLRVPPSSLQNEYSECSYSPIGKYLLIQDFDGGVKMEELKNNPKVVERVLQSALDFAAANFLNIRGFHSLDLYKDLLKTNFKGLERFTRPRKICINKNDCRNFVGENGRMYQFHSVCSFTCAAQCDNTQPLSERLQDVVFCKSCYEDPKTVEWCFHFKCSDKFHTGDTADHILKKLDWESYRDRPEDWRNMFSASHKTGGVGKTALSSIQADSIGMFGVNLGCDAVSFFRGKITAKEFAVSTFKNLVSSLISSAVRCGAGIAAGIGVGILFGPIGVLFGGFIGGLLGSLAGYWIGKKIAHSFADYMGWTKKPEDEQKADVIIDALILLDLPIPSENLQGIQEADVNKCFRRKALQCHPDKLQPEASDEERAECQLEWGLIEFSRNVLVSYCREPHSLPSSVVKIVNKTWRKKKEEVDLQRMQQNIDKLRNLDPERLQRMLLQ